MVTDCKTSKAQAAYLKRFEPYYINIAQADKSVPYNF